jgi:sigma-B regulation protein RsbU (phosphoserine phosphatase)
MGRAGVAFAVTFSAWLLLFVTGQMEFLRAVFLLGVLITGAWLLLRVFRWVAQQAVWRLRHRLIVTYLFIGVAPVALLASVALLAGYWLMLQVAMSAVTKDLEYREIELASVAEAIGKVEASSRATEIPHLLNSFFTTRYVGLSVVLRQDGRETRIPSTADVPPPLVGFEAARGVVHREGEFFLWSYRKIEGGDITLVAPLSPGLLRQFAPEFGFVTVDDDVTALADERGGARGVLPVANSRLDPPLFWFALLRSAEWNRPAEPARDFRVGLQTRMSTVVGATFNRKTDLAQGFVQAILVGGVMVFLLVGLICWVIGVTMTRTITGTVHHLYEGTQRVMEGRFSHRMAVEGRDQLAEVGSSFNRMTAHLEQLVVVSKEKERLQSEMEIAREVQNQLYPRLETRSSHLSVAAVFRPARLVSGDYFDYESVREGQVALAIGDVAGKGISAALLMASIQSSLRTQLGHGEEQSTAAIVGRLNRHLCASTSPEKYATLCLGLYNEGTGALTYCNAGHLPPVLIRAGQAQRFEVNGTVVGAFANVEYEQSSVYLESGDLLALVTDGLTEPENEFGEMFGEERLIDLLLKNAHRSEQQVVDLVLEAIRHWTGSDELQDDITLMVVRRL